MSSDIFEEFYIRHRLKGSLYTVSGQYRGWDLKKKHVYISTEEVYMETMNFEGVSPELAPKQKKKLKILDRGALNINLYSYKPLNAGWVREVIDSYDSATDETRIHTFSVN